jgi:SAM-dependent methyltransferase
VAGVTFDQAYFDQLYRENPDPWDFRSSDYEKEKYAATLAALPCARYAHIMELGSSIGELTALLATRAARVTGVETSPIAIAAAQARCSACPNVSFVQAHLPHGDWLQRADAVVMSEVLYYMQPPDIVLLASRLSAGAAGAHLILVHWTGETNYPLTGDNAAEHFIDASPTYTTRTFRAPRYRLDVMTLRASAAS